MVIADPSEPDAVKAIDLGAGHSSAGQSLTERIIVTLKSSGLLNESVGAGYLERNWPPALRESGAWALSSMRQAFLNGALTRLADPDTVLRQKIVEFVARGDFGLASGQKPDGNFERIWFGTSVGAEEVAFDAQMFLLSKQRAQDAQITNVEPAAAAKSAQPATGGTRQNAAAATLPGSVSGGEGSEGSGADQQSTAASGVSTIRVSGQITPEVWNKLGVRILPRLKGGAKLRLAVDLSCEVTPADAAAVLVELRQAIADLKLENSLTASGE